MTCKKYQKPIDKKINIYDFSDSDKKVAKGTLLLKGVCPCCGKEIFQINNVSKLNNINDAYQIT